MIFSGCVVETTYLSALNLQYLLKTNLCQKIHSSQGQGLMPVMTSRFNDSEGKTIYHFMRCSTISEYSVLAEISCAKIGKEISLDTVCLFGCGVVSGLGAVWNTCKVEVS